MFTRFTQTYSALRKGLAYAGGGEKAYWHIIFQWFSGGELLRQRTDDTRFRKPPPPPNSSNLHLIPHYSNQGLGSRGTLAGVLWNDVECGGVEHKMSTKPRLVQGWTKLIFHQIVIDRL